MADTSPGKVQALTAMFAQKNEPIMGMYRHGIKARNSSWNRTTSPSLQDNNSASTKSCSIEEVEVSPPSDFKISKTALVPPLKMKVLPSVIKPKTELNATQSGKFRMSDVPSCDMPAKSSLKPCVGPKPSLSQTSSASSSSLHLGSDNMPKDQSVNGNCLTDDTSELAHSKKASESECSKTETKSWVMGETIASFMFAGCASPSKTNSLTSEVKNGGIQLQVPVPTPRKSIRTTPPPSNTELLNKSNSDVKDSFRDPYSNIINSDNYICKNNVKFRRKKMPPKDKLGQPPLKPIKPLHMKLQSQCNGKVFRTSSPITPQRPPPVSLNLLTSTPQKPTYPCPPRPSTSPPPRPPCAPPSMFTSSTSVELSESQSSCRNSIIEETEELYEDTMLDEKPQRPVSLIPECTEEEERAGTDVEELYDDAGDTGEDANSFTFSQPIKPKHPPPPPPSCLETSGNYSSDDLYQDALDIGDENEEFYEVMPVDYLPQEDQDSPVYSNNRKEIEKLRREEEKKIRRELKEREKKEKEKDKLKKKFGLTGEEIPIDAGLVKSDCRGSRNDLPVKRGETVLILRMEGNPSGKWLVKNERGKIGYVELTNIEVDPDSVKSVMSVRRTSVLSEREELYCEAASEEEAIYETTY